MEISVYTAYNEEEILSLYESVGWQAYTAQPDMLRKGLEHSLLTLAAREEGRLIGLARVVGDGYTVAFVQDILVHPACQRRGVGTALMREICGRYAHVRQIMLATDDTEKNKAFYRSLGFEELSRIGCCAFMRMK